jgi:hypothetical protein
MRKELERKLIPMGIVAKGVQELGGGSAWGGHDVGGAEFHLATKFFMSPTLGNSSFR